MSIALSILSLAGMVVAATGIYMWRREGFGALAGILIIGGAAIVIVCVGYQCSSGKEARFTSSLKPSMQIDRHPPPLPHGVRPPKLPRPGPERVGDSLIIA